MKLIVDELAKMMFVGFDHHWNYELCKKVAAEILEKMSEPEPVIEVGDIVAKKQSVGCPTGTTSHECEILKRTGGTHIRLGDLASVCACWSDVSSVNFIRKGPKVHTFKRVKISEDRSFKFYGNSRDDIEQYREEMDFNKRYTTTFTEVE